MVQTHDTDLTQVAMLGTSDLIDHIISTHHATMQREVSRLDRLFSGASDLSELASAWRRVSRDLLEHQEVEELEIFPSVRTAASCASLSGTSAVIARAALIDKLVHDHRRIEGRLGDVRELVEASRRTQDSPILEQIDAGLAALAADMRDHSRKEDKVLFPRLLTCLE